MPFPYAKPEGGFGPFPIAATCRHPRLRSTPALLTLLAAVAVQQVSAQGESAPGSTRVLPTVTVEEDAEKENVAPTGGPQSTLEGGVLRSRAAGTLGTTLQDERGVANASFGPNVGLPLIRGQGGSRVRVMVGNTGTHDASMVSADHAVMVEPGLAERITVHRGPSVVRFGGNAISGAVEVDNRRIPTSRPRSLKSRTEARIAGTSRFTLVRMDGPASATSAWHVDAHSRSSALARIPGLAIDEDAVRSQFFLVNGRNTRGFIDNSDARSDGAAVGGTHFFDNGYLGLALSSLSMNYGIPPGAHSHTHVGPVAPLVPAASEAVRIQARQHRLDAKSEIDLPWDSAPLLKTWFSSTNYAHDEVDNGRVGTTFRNAAQEARLELEHQLTDSSFGTAGLHLQRRDFSALGLEAFVPRTQNSNAAAFVVERWDWPSWSVEFGGRMELQTSRPEQQTTNFGIAVALPERQFRMGSMSIAVTRQTEVGDATLTYWSSARAPDIQELYSLGPHLATRTYDFGNSALDIERLRGWNLAFAKHGDGIDLHASVFQYRVASHIYQRNLGVFYDAEKQQFRALCAQLDQCLPVTRYEQAAAGFRGFEAEIAFAIPATPWQRATGRIFADHVRGRLPGLGQDIPRMPPTRWGIGLAAEHGPWSADLRIVRSLAQNRPGENETATRGSTQLHASIRWEQTTAKGAELAVFVVGRNLTNSEVRASTSFLRNYAPEQGRSVEVGLELRF
jgi:iron complex outermembrane receptor protein